MGIQTEIVSIGQQIDVDTGKACSTLVLRLADGHMFDALINDETVRVITALIGQRMAGVSSPMPQADNGPVFGGAAAVAYAPPGEDATTSVFGGEAPAMEAREPEPPRPIRAPVVQKDEMGYPIMPKQQQADPGEVVGTGDRDEDGVAAL